MVRRAQQVSDLAREAGADLDEALVTLWDAGLDFLDDPSDLVPTRHVAVARSALGIASPREQMTVAYWVRVSGLSPEELAQRVAPLGVNLSPTSRRIPKNSLRRFRRAFQVAETQTVPLTSSSSATKTPMKATPPEEYQFTWESVGRKKGSIRHLEHEDILMIHEELEQEFRRSKDPILPPGVKDDAQVSMSAQRPHTALGQILKYPTVEMAGAALFHSIIQNHGFHNGNKRTALVSLVAFLDRNGQALTCSEDVLYKTTLRVAQHSVVPTNLPDLVDREVLHIAKWIEANSRVTRKEDTPIRWHKLRTMLSKYGCQLDSPGTGGNRLNIVRQVERRDVLSIRRRRTKTLKVQVAWAGDSTEADANTIRRIRSKMELDSEHGIDSLAFYGDADPVELIERYSHILKRLSRL